MEPYTVEQMTQDLTRAVEQQTLAIHRLRVALMELARLASVEVGNG